jgi:hypothetical protein
VKEHKVVLIARCTYEIAGEDFDDALNNALDELTAMLIEGEDKPLKRLAIDVVVGI